MTPNLHSESSALYLLIVGCEVAFWVVLLIGLAFRYLLNRPAASRWLLVSLPVIDVLLLLFTALDLETGRTATAAHGLAAAYVGFTIAFGSIVVRWADERFAYRFASGPAPIDAPIRGWEAVRYEFRLWVRCIAAWIIAFALLEALILYVANDAVTTPLLAWYRYGLGCIVFWFVFGPAWSLVFSWRRAQTRRPTSSSGGLE